jgi:hypothetical protein
VFSFRDADPKAGGAVELVQRAAPQRGLPAVNWTEFDIWSHIGAEDQVAVDLLRTGAMCLVMTECCWQYTGTCSRALTVR